MYLGKIVEMGNTEEIYSKPLHPYTRALFSAMPRPEPMRRREKPSLSGEIGSALDLPGGCRFRPRCDYGGPECSEIEPLLAAVTPNHQVACHKFSSWDK